MPNDLTGCFEKIKNCSLEIIDILEKENYDSLESKLDERQELINSINKLAFTKQEINAVCEKLKIMELSQRINDLINNKKVKVKELIKQNVIKQNANDKYNKNFYDSSHVFSRKV